MNSLENIDLFGSATYQAVGQKMAAKQIPQIEKLKLLISSVSPQGNHTLRHSPDHNY